MPKEESFSLLKDFYLELNLGEKVLFTLLAAGALSEGAYAEISDFGIRDPALPLKNLNPSRQKGKVFKTFSSAWLQKSSSKSKGEKDSGRLS